MNAKTVLLSLAFVTATLPFLPEGSAVGTCTYALNAVQERDCPYLFCYGTRWSYPDRYVECYECFDPFRAECDWPTRLP